MQFSQDLNETQGCTYDMFAGSKLTGVHVNVLFTNMAPCGRVESSVTMTSSPSWSNVITFSTLCCPTATLNVVATVIVGLALAVNGHDNWET